MDFVAYRGICRSIAVIARLLGSSGCLVSHMDIYNKVYYRLSHDVVTWDVDRDVSTAYC